jgi:uncharacterized protein YbcI
MSAITVDRRESAIVSQISRGIVGVYVDFHGRGPTKVRTIWHRNIVVCVLREVFTRTEDLLVEGQRFDLVRAQRQAISEEIAPGLRAVVESATGLQVISLMSDVSREGIASEVFVLGGP